MEFFVEKLQGKYHLSSYGGGVGNPYIFHKYWGIDYKQAEQIFKAHNAEEDVLFYFNTEDEAEAALMMLSLLRCNYDRCIPS